MNKYAKLAISVLAVMLLFVGAVFLYTTLNEKYQAENAASQEDINIVPEFTVLDADGNEVSISELRGKPVVLNFWATWCTYCKQSMPDMEEAFALYGDDVHFMMVNAGEAVNQAEAYISDNGYTFPVYFDPASEASAVFAASGLPVTYFIGSEGEMIARALGKIGLDTIEQGIEMITK